MRTQIGLSALSAAILVGCGGGGDAGADSGAPPPSGPADSYPAHAGPLSAPPYACLTPGSSTVAVMQRLNAFWQSNVVACACDSFALAQGCFGNAFGGNGYIFYDRDFLTYLDSTSGSTLPADFFIAHEFGHNVQTAFGAIPPGKVKELQADCLGGYYVGHEIRAGRVAQSELLSTFNFACSIGDPVASNWWDPTHGTCGERVSALQRGISGYNAMAAPLNACN